MPENGTTDFCKTPAMKKIIVIRSVLAVVAMACVMTVARKVLTVTDPYLIEPSSRFPADAKKQAGSHFDEGSGTLIVISTNEVVVVADPGGSFQHEILWLTERPKEGAVNTQMEYQFDLPPNVAPDHIKPAGSQIPPAIRDIATRKPW